MCRNIQAAPEPGGKRGARLLRSRSAIAATVSAEDEPGTDSDRRCIYQTEYGQKLEFRHRRNFQRKLAKIQYENVIIKIIFCFAVWQSGESGL
jgi:hypothetical protein